MVETFMDVCYNASALCYSAVGETGLFGVSVHACIDFVKVGGEGLALGLWDILGALFD